MQGPIGYTGSQGIQGVIGYTGSKGDQGVIGYTGSRGYTGSASTVQGPIGYTGSKGDIGYTGSSGDCYFMLSDTDLETNLADSEWREEFFSSPLRLTAVSGGALRGYWWPYIADTDSSMEFIASDTKMLSNVLADKVATDAIWVKPSSEKIWTTIGTPTPPHTYTTSYGGVYLETVDYTNAGGLAKAVRIYQPNMSLRGTYAYSFDLNLTDISTLKLFTKRAVSSSGYSSFYTEIKIDGTTVYSENGSDSGLNYYLRSFDVSSLSGTVSIVFQMRITTTYGSSSYHWSTCFARIFLEA